ncbi:MAG: beta-L-arabinofuranosidase domain-containing protein, partial [Planctomycetota bacterium]
MVLTVLAAPRPAHARQLGFGFDRDRVEARPFALEQVRLLEGPFREARRRDIQYLRSLEVDRLLHTWRKNAGLPTDAEPLGGWERPSSELRGHSMGHFLSACALAYAGTGNEMMKEKAQKAVAGLEQCQQALDKGGYLSAFPESLVDRALNREDVWAPFYTLHKVFAGLLDVYRYCGSDRALRVAKGMGDWLHRRLEPIDREEMQKILTRPEKSTARGTEQGGINEALANLYAVTGERKYLELAQKFQQDSYNKPLARGEDNLAGEHANSFIPTVVGTARLYELTGKSANKEISRHFWDLVVHGRTYCTGGTSDEEHWGKRHVLPLGEHTQEFCCTYNMLKLTRHLMCWDPRAEYADYYERGLWNNILATQNPKTNMMGYFLAMAPGRWKYFCTPNRSFWCCTGTGMESHAKYGANIYLQG